MRIPIRQIDAFTSERFRGNPAAVCVLDPEISAQLDAVKMQQIAAEMNLSETAFVTLGSDPYPLRWFTPNIEVDLCGHATLAAAFVLWQDGHVDVHSPIEFETRSGKLTCRLVESPAHTPLIQLDFPALEFESISPPDELTQAMGVRPVAVVRSQMDHLIHVISEEEVLEANPDMALLARFPARGVILTAISDSPDRDFVSRFFAPGAGVPEDPVTGSAHCLLGPFWNSILGRSEFTAYQASRRGGFVRLALEGNRVLLQGSAVRVFYGELEL